MASPVAVAAGTRLRFLTLGGLVAVGAAATDMYAPAFPQVCDDLGVSAAAVQLSVAVFLVGMALGQLLAGSASDALGRRGFVLIGTTGFVASSIACAFAPTIEVLIALRALQGLTAAAGIVVGRAIVQDLYGPGAVKIFSRLIIITGLAPILAPSVGAFLLQFFDWRAIFVTQGVLGVLLLLMAWRSLPESLPVEQRSPFTLGFVLARNRALLRNRQFRSITIAYGFACAIVFAYVGGYSFLVQDVYHQSERTFAILFGVNAIGMVAFAQINGRISHHGSIVRLVRVGLLSSTAVSAALVVVVALHLSVWWIAAAMWFVVATRGFIMPNLTVLAMSADDTARGSASALLGTLQWASGAVAAPLAGIGGRTSGLPMAITILSFSAVAMVLTYRALKHWSAPAHVIPEPSTMSEAG